VAERVYDLLKPSGAIAIVVHTKGMRLREALLSVSEYDGEPWQCGDLQH
jgi:hypothetical protein